MPQPPNVDGLPGWLQVTITLLFGAVTLIVGLKGYRSRPRDDAPVIQAPMAHIADMSAIRHLTETCHTLCGAIVSLERSLNEHTHYERQSAELEREVAQRLRELKERLDRFPGV